ncbi:MAG TPA: S8 family serine peptidase, partial [Pyrinomonadaceae bacterium]
MYKRPLMTWLVIFSLLAAPLAGTALRYEARAQTGQTFGAAIKVSEDLLAQVSAAPSGARLNVIVQSNGPWSSTLDSVIQSNNGATQRAFDTPAARLVNLPAQAVTALAARNDVFYISPDRDVAPLGGHMAVTTGTDAVRKQTNAKGQAYNLDGTGIGIAVLDSGVYSSHKAFLDSAGKSRISYSKDFTGENRIDDPYGHGTYVAATAAGSGRISSGAYIGIAPNAKILNLRVLNSKGVGSTSKLLTALDWVYTNRNTYAIKVVNLSLGGAAIDSYKTDPVCRSV